MAKKAAAPKTAKAPKATKKSKAAALALEAASEKYRSLMEKVASSKAEPYRMSHTYTIDVKIEHPKFGLGVVTGAWTDKIEVIFPDSTRHLVQNRK